MWNLYKQKIVFSHSSFITSRFLAVLQQCSMVPEICSPFVACSTYVLVPPKFHKIDLCFFSIRAETILAKVTPMRGPKWQGITPGFYHWHEKQNQKHYTAKTSAPALGITHCQKPSSNAHPQGTFHASSNPHCPCATKSEAMLISTTLTLQWPLGSMGSMGCFLISFRSLIYHPSPATFKTDLFNIFISFLYFTFAHNTYHT